MFMDSMEKVYQCAQYKLKKMVQNIWQQKHSGKHILNSEGI